MDFPTSTLGYILFTITLVGWSYREYRSRTSLVRSDNDAAEQSLISTQKQLLEAMEKKVENFGIQINELQKQQDINVAEIQELKKVNETLTKVFQGRDEATQEFQKSGKEAFTLIVSMSKSIETQNNHIENLYKIISEMVKKLPN